MQYTGQLIRSALAALFALTCVLTAPVAAQNPFAAVAQVNEDVITGFELAQRQQLLRIISPADSGRDAALKALVDERLQVQAARQAGLSLTSQDIRDGIAEFAGRVDLSADEFLQALAQSGVEKESFASFVEAGLMWRDLIRGRYGNRVNITERDVDRALAAASTGGGVRVLLSEIIMPAPPRQREAVIARAERIAQTRSTAEFSANARRYSATASRGRGGRLDWLPITQLPPNLRPRILALSVGEVTPPITIPNAVALFQLRGIEETSSAAPEYSAIEYAQFFIPGGRSDAALAEAARVKARVDVCDDLYGIAKDLPEERLLRDSKKPGEIPQDIALELAKLDDGEVSTTLVSADGQALVFLMMCGRTAAANEGADREAVLGSLQQARLSGFADSLLEQLRSEARIREK